jgi:hypothetical protein
VFTLPESPLRARELKPVQRLSYFVSLVSYLAPPMRLLLLLTLALVLWTGELPMKISIAALAALWLPSIALNFGAGGALARGFMRIGESAHYELLTMEIYTRALRCAVRPGRTAFKVTRSRAGTPAGSPQCEGCTWCSSARCCSRAAPRCGCSTWSAPGRFPTFPELLP